MENIKVEKKHMSMIRNYLENENIPYHENKLGVLINNKTINEFMIPGCIIKPKMTHAFLHGSSINRINNWINNIFKHIIDQYDANYKIYLFICDFADNNNNKSIEQLRQYIPNTSSNIRVISDIRDITVADYIYTASCGPIWSFISDDKLYRKYKDVEIHITREIYNASIVVMTDDELKKINTMKLIVDDEDVDDNAPVVFIVNKACCVDLYCATDFFHCITYSPLPGGKRIPIRHIDGLTKPCANCNEPMYKRIKKYEVCIKCSTTNHEVKF